MSKKSLIEKLEQFLETTKTTPIMSVFTPPEMIALLEETIGHLKRTPSVEIELPEGDERQAKVRFTEWNEDTRHLHVCLSVSEAASKLNDSLDVEPLAWACWSDQQDPSKDKPGIVSFEPMAYAKRLPLFSFAQIAKIELSMVQFIQDVAQQKPEKPDYWSACGQCERNISRAEDLIQGK